MARARRVRRSGSDPAGVDGLAVGGGVVEPECFGDDWGECLEGEMADGGDTGEPERHSEIA